MHSTLPLWNAMAAAHWYAMTTSCDRVTCSTRDLVAGQTSIVGPVLGRLVLANLESYLNIRSQASKFLIHVGCMQFWFFRTHQQPLYVTLIEGLRTLMFAVSLESIPHRGFSSHPLLLMCAIFVFLHAHYIAHVCSCHLIKLSQSDSYDSPAFQQEDVLFS